MRNVGRKWRLREVQQAINDLGQPFDDSGNPNLFALTEVRKGNNFSWFSRLGRLSLIYAYLNAEADAQIITSFLEDSISQGLPFCVQYCETHGLVLVNLSFVQLTLTAAAVTGIAKLPDILSLFS